jgi:hypothetical protein
MKTPTICTTTINFNLVWPKEFLNFYALIFNTIKLKEHAFMTYPNLTWFLSSWVKYRKDESLPRFKPKCAFSLELEVGAKRLQETMMFNVHHR